MTAPLFRAQVGVRLDGIAEELARVERDTSEKIRQLLEAVGILTVAFLRSFTSETRPPVRGANTPRPAHPGHWADISGHLALSYDKEVKQSEGGGWLLELSNSAEYAAALEARDGFFVLSGVTDRGGPVEEAVRRAVAQVAPDWTVTVYP